MFGSGKAECSLLLSKPKSFFTPLEKRSVSFIVKKVGLGGVEKKYFLFLN